MSPLRNTPLSERACDAAPSCLSRRNCVQRGHMHSAVFARAHFSIWSGSGSTRDGHRHQGARPAAFLDPVNAAYGDDPCVLRPPALESPVFVDLCAVLFVHALDEGDFDESTFG